MPRPFDATKPVQTRDGEPVRIICTDAANHLPLIGLIMNDKGQEIIAARQASGRAFTGEERSCDFVNVVEKISKFVNQYGRESSRTQHDSLESAMAAGIRSGHANSPFLGTLELIFHDGEFVGTTFHKAEA